MKVTVEHEVTLQDLAVLKRKGIVPPGRTLNQAKHDVARFAASIVQAAICNYRSEQFLEDE